MKNLFFEIDIENVLTYFPKLQIVESGGERYLVGDLDIIDNNGRLWDTFKIEVKGSLNFPYAFPKLYEVGNDFPKIADWHVYESDNSCCVDVPPNELIICSKRITVKEYLTNMVVPYFANQSFRKREGYYLYGEYSHGIVGRIEYYQNKLRARNPSELIRMIEFILMDYNPDRTAYCPFCKHTKFRKCHRNVFKEFKLINYFLNEEWGILKYFFNTNPQYKLPIVI